MQFALLYREVGKSAKSVCIDDTSNLASTHDSETSKQRSKLQLRSFSNVVFGLNAVRLPN